MTTQTPQLTDRDYASESLGSQPVDLQSGLFMVESEFNALSDAMTAPSDRSPAPIPNRQPIQQSQQQQLPQQPQGGVIDYYAGHQNQLPTVTQFGQSQQLNPQPVQVPQRIQTWTPWQIIALTAVMGTFLLAVVFGLKIFGASDVGQQQSWERRQLQSERLMADNVQAVAKAAEVAANRRSICILANCPPAPTGNDAGGIDNGQYNEVVPVSREAAPVSRAEYDLAIQTVSDWQRSGASYNDTLNHIAWVAENNPPNQPPVTVLVAAANNLY